MLMLNEKLLASHTTIVSQLANNGTSIKFHKDGLTREKIVNYSTFSN